MKAIPALCAAAAATAALWAQPKMNVCTDASGNLMHSVTYNGRPTVLPSALGIEADLVRLGKNVRILKTETRGDLTTYSIVQNANGQRWDVDVRTFDDGVALRYRLYVSNPQAITREYTSVTFPSGTVAHFASAVFQYGYTQRYVQVKTDDITGRILAPPAVFRLPNGTYAALTESNLREFYGCVWEGTAPNTVSVMFAESLGAIKEGKVLGMPWAHRNTVLRNPAWAAPLSVLDKSRVSFGGRKSFRKIITPWRVLMLAKDLNGLTHCGIVNRLADRPDPKLFPNGGKEPWIRPGRCLWSWFYRDIRRRMNYDVVLDYVLTAGDFGYEYALLDEGWDRWPARGGDHPHLRGKTLEQIISNLCGIAAKKGVGIWLWHTACPRWNGDGSLVDPKKREEFFAFCNRTGVRGVKLDFFHRENVPTVRLTEDILRDAAKHHLMVVLHGTNKPTGDSVTYPNLLAKEAVSGLENVNWGTPEMAPWDIHDTTLPFTRWLAGPADYTPVNFRTRVPAPLTYAHMAAQSVMFTSPMLILAIEPADLRTEPIASFFRDLPNVWDESVVLEPSKIGDVAVIARRSGKEWWLSAFCTGARRLTVDLSFLKEGTWTMEAIEDAAPERKKLRKTSAAVRAGSRASFGLLDGGGVLVRFRRQ